VKNLTKFRFFSKKTHKICPLQSPSENPIPTINADFHISIPNFPEFIIIKQVFSLFYTRYVYEYINIYTPRTPDCQTHISIPNSQVFSLFYTRYVCEYTPHSDGQISQVFSLFYTRYVYEYTPHPDGQISQVFSLFYTIVYEYRPHHDDVEGLGQATSATAATAVANALALGIL
jgi:hypothetical protein